jgi:hypothetical protein
VTQKVFCLNFWGHFILSSEQPANITYLLSVDFTLDAIVVLDYPNGFVVGKANGSMEQWSDGNACVDGAYKLVY